MGLVDDILGGYGAPKAPSVGGSSLVDDVLNSYASREQPQSLFQKYGMPALQGVGSVLGAPKHVVDIAANYYGPQGDSVLSEGLTPEVTPTGTLAKDALLPPDEAQGSYLQSAARAGIGLGVDLATDPLVAGLGVASKVAGAGRAAAKVIGPQLPEGALAIEQAIAAGQTGHNIGRAAAAAFAPGMAMGAAQALPEAYQTYQDEGFTPRVLETGLEGLASAGFAGASALHALTPYGVPPIGVPETAKRPAVQPSTPRGQAPMVDNPAPVVDRDFVVPEDGTQPVVGQPPASLPIRASDVAPGTTTDQPVGVGAAGPERRVTEGRDELSAILEGLPPDQRALMQEHLRKLQTESSTDPLTGLLGNREWIRQRQEPVQGRRYVSGDVKGFKGINDTVGHINADEGLKAIAQVWAKHLGGDKAFRPTGDEFTGFLDGIPDAEIPARLEAIRNEISGLTVSVRMPDGSTLDLPKIIMHLGSGENAEAAEFAVNADRNRQGSGRDPGPLPTEPGPAGGPEGGGPNPPPELGEQPKEPPAPRADVVPPGVNPKKWAKYVKAHREEYFQPKLEAYEQSLRSQPKYQKFGAKWKDYISPEEKSKLAKLQTDWRRVPDPPKDSAGNPIIVGQEDWTSAERTAARQHAEWTLKEIAAAEKAAPVGQHALNSLSGATAAGGGYESGGYGTPSHKAGTFMENLPYSRAEADRGFRVDKGNPVEQDVLAAAKRDLESEGYDFENPGARPADDLNRGDAYEDGTGDASFEPAKFSVRPSPGQQGIPGLGADVPELGTKKKAPEQGTMFGGDMLQGVASRTTEGREAEGDLFTQDARSQAKAEAESQGTLPKYSTRAFHGSPHDFDSFSSDKIGTGEGAQAYGHGLYFAGKKAVAEHYRDVLSNQRDNTDNDGSRMVRTYGSKEKAIVAAREHYQYDIQHNPTGPARAEAERYYAKLSSEIEAFNAGKLYEVDLSPDEGDYLLWDKPLSEQSEKVKAAFRTRGFDPDGEHATMTGERAYGTKDPRTEIPSNDLDYSGRHIKKLQTWGFNDGPAASAALKKAGIPGIKYLDGSSRGQGEGSHNYVLFDDSLVKVKAKYKQGDVNTATVDNTATIAPDEFLKRAQANWRQVPGIRREGDAIVMASPSGKPVVMRHTGEIVFDRADLEKGHGTKLASGVVEGTHQVTGQTYSTNARIIAEAIDLGSLDHEVGHVLKDHFATARERAAIERDPELIARAKETGQHVDEAWGDWFSEYMAKDRAGKRPEPTSVLHRVAARILDWMKRVKQTFAPSKEGFARSAVSGDVFKRAKPIPAGVEAKYATGPKRINPDALPREILTRMSQRLKSQGFDVRGADDVLDLLKSGRVFKDGAFTQEEWKAAYEAATGTRENRQAKAKTEKELTPHVDWAQVRRMGTTSDPNVAGYIRPDGKPLDLSGGRSGGTRGEDHRIVGGHAGMQELKAAGYIRFNPGFGFDISAMPSAEQLRQIGRLSTGMRERVLLDLADGLGEFNASRETYTDALRRTSLEFPAGTKPEKIVGMIRRFYGGEDIESGVKYATSPKPHAQPETPNEKGEGFGQPGGQPDIAPNIGRMNVTDQQRTQAQNVIEDAQEGLKRNTPQSFESLKPEIEQIQKTMSDQELLALANRRQLEAPEAMALKQRLDQKTREFDEALGTGDAKKIMAKSLDMVAHARALANDGTDVARALNARKALMEAGTTVDDRFLRRIFKEIPGATDSDAARLLTLYKTDPAKLPDALVAAMKPGVLKRWIAWWKAGLLSAPSTDVANMSGNALESAAQIMEGVLSSGIDKVLAKGGNRERFLGESKAELSGLLESFGPALKQLKNDLVDVHKLKPAVVDVDDPRPLAQQVGAFTGKLGKASQTPFGRNFAEDRFAKSLGAHMILRKLAYRQAKGNEALAKQLVREAMEQGRHPELIEAAGKMARERVFQDDPSRGVQALDNFARQFPALEFVAPFRNVPERIAARTIQRSPLGFIAGKNSTRNVLKRYKAGEATRGEVADSIARPLLGTMILTGFGAAAQAGMMTGSGPVDEKQKAALRDSGWSPYSFKIPKGNGKHLYIPFNRFEPVSSLLGFAADMVEAKSEKDAGDVVSKAMNSLGSNLISKSYLQGLADAAGVISRPDQALATYATDFVGSQVPNIVKRAATAIDPVVRDVKPERSGLAGLPERAVKTVASRIPGVSSMLPARKTMTGADMERGGNALTRFASPSIPTSERDGKAVEGLLAKIGGDALPPTPKKALTARGKEVKLTDEEYAVLISGNREATKIVARLMQQSNFQRLPDSDADARGGRSKEGTIQDIYRREHSKAKNRVLNMRSFRQRALRA